MRKNMNKYAEVIVTYNRKKLLKENIEALLNQTFKDHDILIVDNNSNDGTKEMVAEIQDKRIKYYNTGKNLGGAGGFAFGLRKAIELGYLYAWIMDDDSIPEKEALQSLVDKGQALDGEFAQLGIPTYGIRACAKVRDNREELSKMVQELFIINLVMSALAYVVYFAAIYYVPRFRQDKDLFLIVGLTIFFNAIGMEWLYKALEQYTYITVRSIIFKFIAIVAMFLMVHEQSDYVIYGGISILASSASNIFNFFHIHRYVNIKPVGHYNFKKHLKAIVIFFAMSCATTIYTHLDTVMLGFIRTDADVGYYNAAVKIKTILVSIVTSLGVVLLPRASYYVEHSMMDEFYRITKKAINFVFLIATPMMIFFMLFAKEGVFFLSGDAYAGAIIPMQVIMPTLLFIGLTNIMGIQMLVPLGKEKVVLYSEIAGMIVDIILNALLIPKMASTGAAIGTLAAEIAVFIVQYVALRGIIKEAYRQVHYVAIGSSVLAGGVLAVLIKRMQWGSFMTLCASAIVFFGVYFLILTIAKESLVIEIENQLLGRIIKKK